ncbi:restriction endonuclease subunit S [Klebsiella pneumoniae]|uniref:restriction endonuclease subunit S n=1 Tax=Klebsiella pneumoniae TaxID=573 RepID=UPI0035C10ADA
MSELSYLEKLLDGAEVEWLTAAEIFNIKNGYTPSKAKKEFWEDGNIPWFRLEDIRTNGRELNDSIMHVNQAGVKGNLFPKDSIFMSTTATIGEFALVKIPHLTNQQITNFSLTSRFKGIIDIRYLFHRFHHFGEWCKENANKSGGLSIIGIKKLSSYKFPIPCPDNPEKSLAIQSEIVRILDKFTALTAELTAELTARKKQYNYYRDQLLSFDENEVEWKALGEVAVIGTGNHDTQDAIEHGKYIFYARGREPLKLNVFDFDETAIITAGDGAGVGKVFHYAKGKYALHQRAYRIVPNAFMNPRFVYHYITAYFFTYIQKASVSSSVTSLRRPMFLKFPIPVPPSEEQARIVEILDKFDTLTNSITEGLPREIELRQKQYEYYRDLLFSFPKPDSVTN